MAIERPAIFFSDVMNRTDIGVIRRGRGLRLALKTGEGLRVSCDLSGHGGPVDLNAHEAGNGG
jgi:hypothetical protein